MLPEIGASELLIIAVVALIVVGPKDLPVLLRKLGQFMAKLRGMASEFRASFDEMARQSELDELRKEVEAMRRGQFDGGSGADAEVSQTFSDIHHGLSDVSSELDPGNYPSYQYAEPAPVTIEKVETAKPARTRKAPAKAPAATKAPAKRAAASAAPVSTKSAPAKRKPKAAAEPKS